MSVEHIQPQGLPKPPTYSHVVKAGNTVYVAGQVAQDEKASPWAEATSRRRQPRSSRTSKKRSPPLGPILATW